MSNIEKDLQIDNVDRKILACLLRDANMPYTEIAKRVFTSSGTIHVRMKKMEELGLVKGSQIIIEHTLLGWDITAFIGIYLDKSSFYEKVIEELKEIPEIVNAHYTTGMYGIFAKIICKDTNHLRQVLNDKIQKVKGIQRTETFISLEESINRTINLL